MTLSEKMKQWAVLSAPPSKQDFYPYPGLPEMFTTLQEVVALAREMREALASCHEEYNGVFGFQGATGMEQVFDAELVKAAKTRADALLGE